MNLGQSNSNDTIRDLVLDFLELLPEPMKRVARFGSIPNAFTPKLIQQMAGEEANIGDFLDTLEQHYFINKGEGDWFYYSSEVREIIRAFWQQPELLQQFQNANHIAIAYFDDLANQTKPPGNYVFQREALYHRLLEDENAGLEYMADLFERACDQRQIGAAQTFSIRLRQTLPHLSPLAAQYASYYEMRLDFLLNQREKLEEGLAIIIGKTSDLLLKARAAILLGQVWLASYEWKKSADILKASLETLKKLEAWRYAARAMLALGDLYVDLVENSGGVQRESANDFSKLSRFLTRLLFVPFLLLDWLRRKIWFLPGWFYFGGNYQEWILNYLLQMAGSWYRRAGHMAQKVKDDPTSLGALIGEANVAVQQRREAKARRIYSKLARLPAVHSSRYHLAQVLYGQGQVSQLANDETQARQELEISLNIFQSFSDEANLALVAQALGATYLQLGDIDGAAKTFLQSFQAYRETQDSLSQTQVSWELERLIENKHTSNSMKHLIKEMLSNLREKHYVARFPSDLLRRFRTSAYWVALPLSYLLILLIGIVTSVSLIAIESSALEVSASGRLSQLDVFFLLGVGIFPIFLTFWIIELIYAVVGQVWVFLAGYNSLNSLGEQPDRVILTSEAVLVESPGLRKPIRLAWNELQTLVSADYKIWQRPIYLLSRQGIVGSSKSIIIEGITSGYMQIRKEIMQRVGGLVNELNVDLVILAHWTAYVAVLFAIWHAQVLVWANQIDLTVMNENTHVEVPLFLSPLLIFFIVDVIMIFPPLILWRANLQRRFFSEELGKPRRQLLNLLTFSITIFLTTVAILWFVLSPFL
jgi:tetratricopeptide (TPR) repeat protein